MTTDVLVPGGEGSDDEPHYFVPGRKAGGGGVIYGRE